MSCEKKGTKKYTERPSPPFPANTCPGTRKKGNDGNYWLSVPNKNGVHRWVQDGSSPNSAKKIKSDDCKKGEILIEKKGYKRKAYTRADGTYVKATTVKPSNYCAKDQGKKGRTSRGAKTGPYSKSKPWITREGKLGGAGYLKKSAAERHKILDRCYDEYGYRSCLSSIVVLNRNSVIANKYGSKIDADKNWFMNKYGKK